MPRCFTLVFNATSSRGHSKARGLLGRMLAVSVFETLQYFERSVKEFGALERAAD